MDRLVNAVTVADRSVAARVRSASYFKSEDNDMTAGSWKIWNKDDSVEQRTYKRVTGELPEMECTKQLVEMIGEVYAPGMHVLDVGCAAGHYYNGLKRIDSNLQYHGVDSTTAYIEFARKHFKGNSNTSFNVEDIFNLPKDYAGKFDIVYCCNVILHLPSFQVPLKNLITASKKYCFVRTLLSDKTHLSKLLYSDSYDENGEPNDFVFQNTYSFDVVRKTIKSLGDYQVEFIDDRFDARSINEEYKNYNQVQSAVTHVQNDLQIAGSKVFEWKWVKITK
jgi:2-polyprenyl-3-methyl-5-hydroxy-6-metoxy-1,4-benzoquinol methylase